MNTLEIIGFTKDYRTNTDVIYAKISIEEYMSLVGKDYDKFEIQRRRETHKGYARLKRDLQNGALIPTITLAVEPSSVKDYSEALKNKDTDSIVKSLSSELSKVYILDGLQRTYIIDELKQAEINFNKGQTLLLEIWFEDNINHLIYRLIVLNSGQKPMSMRHQIELLFITMRETLIMDVKGLIVLKEKDEERRNKAKEFPFERLVTSYKSFLTKSPEIDKDNIVAERLIEADILDSEEEFLSENFLKFKDYLASYCEIDEQIFRIYNGTELSKFRNWLADANVIQSFFAAISKFGIDEKRIEMIKKSIASLLRNLRGVEIGQDPIELVKYSKIKDEKADPKLYNIGFATRKILTNAFVEFFRAEGEQPWGECWLISSSEL